MRVEPLTLTRSVPAPPSWNKRRLPTRTILGVLVPTLIGVVHVAVVAPHYFVGSFDDDASYVLSAHALLAGHAPFSDYPPGYSALIAPLVWLWPHSFLPLRLFSAVAFIATFPLVWAFMSRRQLGYWVKATVLLLLALGPVFATYGSMVMAEAPFIVVLLLLLLALDSLTGVAGSVVTIVLAAAMLWIKEAGIGLVIGLLLWMLLTRKWRRAVVTAVGVGGLLLPVVIVRLVDGVPLAGARYSLELGGFYQGGLASRLVHVFPNGIGELVGTAIPRTLVPYLSPLPAWQPLWDALSYQLTVLVGLGAILWLRRWRDAVVPMAVLYLLETALWPFVNERRAILILPLLAIWYVEGASTVVRFIATRWRRLVIGGSSVFATAALVVPLSAQFGRDYLFAVGQNSSHFGGSGYAALLSRLGTPAQVVETDYRFATSLFTGHATNWSAFIATSGGTCSPFLVSSAISDDRAAYLLLGDFNKPGAIDSPCLNQELPLDSWAVPLLNTSRDHASVYEIVGPGTGNPTLTALLSVASSPAGTWMLRPGALVSQISIGSAPGPTQLELRQPDGSWTVVASSRREIADLPGATPYLLASFAKPVPATAVRVVVTDGSPGSVTDLAVIGSVSGPTTN